MIRQKSFESNTSTLYLVPTPIGNLQEMTPRALDILKEVSVIAAEDTRNTKKLLMAYGIDTMLMSHHEHNQQVSIPKIIERLENGEDVAVVSDAGYPLVSDPGQKLVQETISHGFNVVSVSGANAAMNALVASGLSCYHYLFYGFLDNKSSKRKKQLEEIKDLEYRLRLYVTLTIPYTMIFYEAPHRIEDTLQDMLEVLGNRQMCLARELTKVHEEYIRGTIEEVLEVAATCKGEMVIVMDGFKQDEVVFDMYTAITKVDEYIESGMRTKEAIGLVAKEMACKKNELYEAYHKR